MSFPSLFWKQNQSIRKVRHINGVACLRAISAVCERIILISLLTNKGIRYRNWVFTLNHYTDAELLRVRGLFADGECTYCGFGKEKGETGIPHLQGYLEFSGKTSLRQCKRLPGMVRAHFERRMGSQTQAVTYCQKEGQYEEFGAKKEQGRRTDLDDICDKLRGRKRLREIAEEHGSSWIRYSRGIRDLDFTLRAAEATTKDRPIDSSVYWGDSDTGKTRSVYSEFGYEDVFKLDRSSTGVWFDGYEGQDTLLIDDFYGWIPFSMLLNILDRYPLRVPIKGGSTWAMWKRVIITSNSCPDRWYRRGVTPSLARRIGVTYHYVVGQDRCTCSVYYTGISLQ